ncbi:MAG: ribosomal L7Ae/L30e/S12e/Gadd45 family protein [Lachnospiraceae bacterium]|nr:ribosomal L7Ae/L30e/S12e/Gadd45 family protein [Lachnospiraceae bacterium]
MDNAEKKILSLISLSAKAGGLVSGELSSENAVKDGSANLVIVAANASDNTKKLFSNKTTFYKVPYFEFSTKEVLGRTIGKENRSSIAVINKNLADNIINKLNDYKVN